MFVLVPAYPGCPGSKVVKRSLLLLLLYLQFVMVTKEPFVKLQEEEVQKEKELKKALLERIHTLPQQPSVIVYPSTTAKAGRFECSVVSLSVLLDYRLEDNKEHSFEAMAGFLFMLSNLLMSVSRVYVCANGTIYKLHCHVLSKCCVLLYVSILCFLQCFDTVGWAAGRASGL